MQRTGNKIVLFFKKNGLAFFLVVLALIITFSPETKSWLLQQIGKTGLFNARISKDSSEATQLNDFNFADEQGQVYSTKSLRGKVLFINFWASWCPPCKAEMPSVQRLYQEFQTDTNLVFLILNEDQELQTGRTYLTKMHYDLPLLTVASTISSEIFKGTLPTTIIIDKSGKVRYHHKGFGSYDSDGFVSQLKKLTEE